MSNTLVVNEVEGILSNDTDPDGDSLTVVEVDGNSVDDTVGVTVIGSNGGQFTIDSDGSYDFDPNGDFDTLGLGDSETTSVTYTVSDGEGGTDTADLVITVGRMGVNIQDDSENEDMISSIDDLTQTIIKGSVPDGCTITGLVISDGNGNEITIDPLDVSITNNSFTITTDVTELVDGELTVKMDLEDPVEGVSGSVTDTIAKDTVTEVTIDPLTVENGEISEITGTGEPGSTITITAEGSGIGTATVETDGTWSFTPSNPLGNDVDNIVADAEDPYGNEASTARDIPTLSIADGGEQTVNEAALADGSDPDLDTEEASGTFTISFDPDDLTEISIGGKTITPDDLAGSEVDTEYGTITINDYDSATGEVSYTYELEGNTEDHSIAGPDDVTDEIEIRVTDSNGDVRVDTLDVTVTDDVPDAVDDSYLSVVEGENTISGNVLANDVQGADTATVTGFSYADESGSTQIASAGDTVDTQYGELTVNSDGSWSYTSDSTESHPGGAALEEAFTYTITDTDGDTSSAEQPISITDTSPAIGTPLDTTVSEANLPTGTAPDGPALVQTESLDVQPGADTFLTTFADGITAPDDLTSGGDPVTYTVSNGGHTLTASADGETVFTVEITDPASSSAGYEFNLYGPLDHTSAVYGTDGQIDLDFGFKVVDSDGSTVSDSFTVAVLDDAPVDTKTLQLDEDTNITVNTNADATPDNTDITDSPDNGTAVINADGTLTYTPHGNYSGGDSLTYTTILDDGTTKTTSVDITVDPVADKPNWEQQPEVSTDEDTMVALDRNMPTITDAIDQNGDTTAGDHPERLGFITIRSVDTGAEIYKGDGSTLLFTGNNNTMTIAIVDNMGNLDTSLHYGDLASDPAYASAIKLTADEFESLMVLPPDDRGNDIRMNLRVTSYETDDSGNIDTSVAGATAGRAINVDVQAVTDGVDLKIDGSDDPYDLTIDEDSTYDIASLLQANLLDTEGNGPDTDGSETRVLVFENIPEGATVNGQEIGADGSITISLPGNDGTLPTINFTPPPDFSGDLEGITVTLQSTDSDGDSSGTIDTLSDSVTLNIFVNPVAGDVEVQDVSTPEDTGVNFLADLDLTDNDGSEEITGITINDVPDGWVIADENGNVVLTGNGNDDLSIDQADVLSGVYKNYTVTPPAHSSADETLSIDVETTDTQTVNGTTQTSVTTVNLSPEVVVTPVAEAVGGDSDGDSTEDLTLNGNFTYTTSGEEDQWFSLDGTDGFDLEGPWANQDADGSEETFALLSGVPEGSQFRFSTDGGSTF